jgi:large subunit ribosomal protein L15
MRMPKLRGIKHPRITAPAKVISVGQLEGVFGEGVLTRKLFVEKGIIKSTSEPVKILDGGEVKRIFQIQGVPISKSAKAKIEKAGGSVKENPPKK